MTVLKGKALKLRVSTLRNFCFSFKDSMCVKADITITIQKPSLQRNCKLSFCVLQSHEPKTSAYIVRASFYRSNQAPCLSQMRVRL